LGSKVKKLYYDLNVLLQKNTVVLTTDIPISSEPKFCESAIIFPNLNAPLGIKQLSSNYH
jgi:hypothetical protein